MLFVENNAPRSRFFHGMTSIGRFLVIMGGACMERALSEVPTLSGPNAMHTFFDLFFFDTDVLCWNEIRRDSSSDESPGARNSFSLARLGNHHVVLFGGGIYQEKYFEDTFALEFELPFLISTPYSCSEKENQLANDLRYLYNSGMLSDATIVVRNRRFTVHKAILASRCDFFKTMFAGPYAEATTDEASCDALPEAVDFVLQFLYTNAVDTDAVVADDEIARSVLTLAAYWNVEKLLKTMETVLSQQLHKYGADPFELIAFAKEHNCHGLAMRCLEFIKQRWPTLKSKDVDPDLAAEIAGYRNSLL